MSKPPADLETIFADVSSLDLDALLRNTESPLLESMHRIADEAEGDVTAGFSDGIS